MSFDQTILARCGVGVCLVAIAAGGADVRAQGAASVSVEKPIVEARLLAPEPSVEGAWLIQVEDVLNGSVPGSVLAIDGLAAEMAALGNPAGEAARLRLVLTPGDGGGYRVLSAHLSPEVDPALADPLPPPLAVAPEVAALHRIGEGFLEPKAAPAPTLEQQVVELVNQERWSTTGSSRRSSRSPSFTPRPGHPLLQHGRPGISSPTATSTPASPPGPAWWPPATSGTPPPRTSPRGRRPRQGP